MDVMPTRCESCGTVASDAPLPSRGEWTSFQAIVDHTILEVFAGGNGAATTLPVHPQNPLSNGLQLRAEVRVEESFWGLWM